MNNRFVLECDDDLIFITVKMYKFFLAHGKDGLEAKQLFDHLLFTSRIQDSKEITANNIYIKNGLGWGRDKLKKAKAFLSAAGLIEYSQEKDESGHFQGQRIILKKTWNTETLIEWIKSKNNKISEDQTGGLEISPPEKNEEITGGLKSSPVEDIASSESETPNSRWSSSPASGSTGPPVTAHNYKGCYNKVINKGGYNSKVITNSKEEIIPEVAAPPPGKSEQSENKKSLFSETTMRIRKIVGPDFSLSKRARESIRALNEITDPQFVLGVVDQLIEEKISRATAWLPRYADSDLRERLGWVSRQQQKKNNQCIPAPALCPCCGSHFIGSNTACSKCGFDKQDIGNDQAIRSHLEWLEKRDKISPFKLLEGDLSVQVSETENGFKAEVKILDDRFDVERPSGSSPNDIAIKLLWVLVKEKISHKDRHSSGMQYSMAKIHVSRHIQDLSSLPDEAFYPKQGSLFDEAM